MKKILLLPIVIMIASQVFAQGSFKITPGTTLKTINGSHVVLQNINLINDGTIQQAVNSGVFDFRGSADDTISGSGITVFDRINLSKDPGSQLIQQRNITVNSEFIFTGGVLYLDNYILDLGGFGNLINESENSRAFTYGTGYIQATRVLNNPSSVNAGNLGATITSTKNLGTTIIRRGHQVQTNIYVSNNSIQRYYDISPANNISLKATLSFSYLDAELNGMDETTLTLWKKKDPVLWDYVGHDVKNATSNYVLRNNISKFSIWTLAFDTASTIVRAVQAPAQKEVMMVNFAVRIFPNPTGTSFNVAIQSADQLEKIQLKVFGINGQIIETLQANPGQIIKIGSNYRAGAYLIEVIQGKQRKTFKVIKLGD